MSIKPRNSNLHVPIALVAKNRISFVTKINRSVLDQYKILHPIFGPDVQMPVTTKNKDSSCNNQVWTFPIETGQLLKYVALGILATF